MCVKLLALKELCSDGCNGARVCGLWMILQGALVICGYERNVYIKSIYKTLREKGKRESRGIQESYIEITS